MNKKQRYIILSIVILIVGYGLINDKMRDKTNDTFEFYVLRAEGERFMRDDLPVFTGKDVFSYDSIEHEFVFTGDFKRKMDDGELMTIIYKDYNDEIIEPENYWLNGVSPLGAMYPDRFLIMIDNHQVLEGYFATPAIMSFLPPGDYVSTTEKGIKLNLGYGSMDLVVGESTENGVSIINLENTEVLTSYDKIEDYFENN